MEYLKQLRDLQLMYNEYLKKKIKDGLMGRFTPEECEETIKVLYGNNEEMTYHPWNVNTYTNKEGEENMQWKNIDTQLPEKGKLVLMHLGEDKFNVFKLIRDFGEKLTMWENVDEDCPHFLHEESLNWTYISKPVDYN